MSELALPILAYILIYSSYYTIYSRLLVSVWRDCLHSLNTTTYSPWPLLSGFVEILCHRFCIVKIEMVDFVLSIVTLHVVNFVAKNFCSHTIYFCSHTIYFCSHTIYFCSHTIYNCSHIIYFCSHTIYIRAVWLFDSHKIYIRAVWLFDTHTIYIRAVWLFDSHTIYIRAVWLFDSHTIYIWAVWLFDSHTIYIRAVWLFDSHTIYIRAVWLFDSHTIYIRAVWLFDPDLVFFLCLPSFRQFAGGCYSCWLIVNQFVTVYHVRLLSWCWTCNLPENNWTQQC